MTHFTTLVQRCRATNSLLADDLEKEFQRLERDNEEMVRGMTEMGQRFIAAMNKAYASAADAVPTNWCDPMLTGPDKVIGSGGLMHGDRYKSADIEAVLKAVRARILALQPPLT